MNWLAENALPIWVGGAVALTLAFVVYLQTRTNRAFFGIVGVAIVTALLLFLNWFIETPREAVERSLYTLAATIEANDVQGALKSLAPTVKAELQKDVETLMPQFKIEMARIMGTPVVEMSPTDTEALVRCQGMIQAVEKRDGMKGAAMDKFVLQWVKSGDRWLLEDYASQKDWNRAAGLPQRGRRALGP